MKPKKDRKKKAKATKTKGKLVVKGKPMFPRAIGNPFREGSSYAAAYDVLAAYPHGLPRQQLVELTAKATHKSTKRAGFDVAVVVSAQTSATGPRHRSCREGYWIEREGNHVKLRTP